MSSASSAAHCTVILAFVVLQLQQNSHNHIQLQLTVFRIQTAGESVEDFEASESPQASVAAASRRTDDNITSNMSLAITSVAIAIAAGLYWYVNRQKRVKHILSDLRTALDMQGTGAGGLIDDWINVRRNKVVLPDANSKVAVITGGARGIGTEVVRGLLKSKMTVVMGIRKPELVKKLAETMENGDKLHAFPLDLQSMKSVKEFADTVLKEFPEIHLLVNNAGIMFGEYKLTEDGFETQLAVNYLGHFYLTHLLLPALKKTGSKAKPSRVVNVTSCAHYPGYIYFDDINFKEHYDTTTAYAQSKLAQLMSARHIDKLIEQDGDHVKCYAVHPGIVDTDLFEKSNFKKFPWIMKMFFKTAEKGAVSILYACFDKDIEDKGGLYISNCREGISSRYSRNFNHQKKLFQLSCNLLGIDAEKFGA